MATNYVGKPPHFNRTNNYWKKRMCLYLKLSEKYGVLCMKHF